MKNKFFVVFVIFTTLCWGCLKPDRVVRNPVSGEIVRTIRVEPLENLTNYDDEPFELNRRIRELIHHRYNVRVVSDNADLTVKMTFRSFRRSTLRQSSNFDTQQNINAEAELKLYDKEGGLIDNSVQSRNESYDNSRSSNFDRALNILLDRLADQLVVDLLEP